jgi:hypothetical protein
MASSLAHNTLIMLTAHKNVTDKLYPDIPPPTLAELETWIANAMSTNVQLNYRNFQFVGASIVDQGDAAPFTARTYKALWATKAKTTCAYCGGNTKSTLMMNQHTCKKLRCRHQHMMQCI